MYCNSGVVKENENEVGVFSVNHGSFKRERVPIGCFMLHFLVTGDAAMSYMTVEISDVSCVSDSTS